MNTWSFGGQPSAPSSGRHCIGDEPHTHSSSSLVTQKPHGVMTLSHVSFSVPSSSRTI
jgi:hypothetical protein